MIRWSCRISAEHDGVRWGRIIASSVHNRANVFFVLVVGICAASHCATAQEVSFIPRLSNGLLIYQFKLDNTFAFTGGTVNSPKSSGFQGFNVNDDLYYGGGGITVTYNHFFLDISGLVTTAGSDDISKQTFNLTNQPLAVTSPLGTLTGTGNGVQTSQGGKAEFTHHEITGLVGYDITESLRMFAGFKYAETPFTIKANTSNNLEVGDVKFNGGSFPFTSATLTAPGNKTNKSTFSQKGPFIGAGYSVPVDILYGSVLINSAISYLHGDIHQKLRTHTEETIFTALSPTLGVFTHDFPAQTTTSKRSLDGKSVGINTGVGWLGHIPTTNISYLLGADGSFYDFQADHSNSDFREISWRLRAELSYRF